MNVTKTNPGTFLSRVLLAVVLLAACALCARAEGDPGCLHGSGSGPSALEPIRIAPTSAPAKTVSALIDGTAGGSVSWGRLRLTVPPGAWYGPATVTMVVPAGEPGTAGSRG